MNKTILSLFFAITMTGCGTEACQGCAPVPDSPNQPEASECGTYADPNVDWFGGCRADTIGTIGRHDRVPAGSGVDLFQCTEDGWEPIEAHCRWFGEDLYCGCGVDDGAGPAP